MNREPALILGLVGSIILGILQQVAGSGIVTDKGGVEILALLIAIVPLVVGAVTRGFVTPAKP